MYRYYLHIYVLWTEHVPSVHPKWYWYVICSTCLPSHPTIYICFLYSSIRHHFSKVFPEWIIVLLHAVICQHLNQSNVLRLCWLCTVDPFYRFNHVSLWSFQRLPYVWWDWDKSSPECQVAGFSQGQTGWKTGMRPEDPSIERLSIPPVFGALSERYLIVAVSSISASTS